jgi:hypothetical protein
MKSSKKKKPPEGGRSNQIPLTIKPYPMKAQRYIYNVETLLSIRRI